MSHFEKPQKKCYQKTLKIHVILTLKITYINFFRVICFVAGDHFNAHNFSFLGFVRANSGRKGERLLVIFALTSRAKTQLRQIVYEKIYFGERRRQGRVNQPAWDEFYCFVNFMLKLKLLEFLTFCRINCVFRYYKHI